MKLMWMLFSVAIVAAVNCQPVPRFEHDNRVLPNNSYIRNIQISTGEGALKCVTNNTNCCTDPDFGNWTYERGRAVQQRADGDTCLYVTRGQREVSLNRNSTCYPEFGLWRCDIPDSSGVIQSMYIYIVNDSSVPILVVDTSVCVLNVPPYNQFTATCTARAEIDGETVPLGIIIRWTRISVSQSGSMNASQINSTEYNNTAIGSPNRGYQSILTTTETDTDNTITYRCRARLLNDSGITTIRQTSDITVTVDHITVTRSTCHPTMETTGPSSLNPTSSTKPPDVHPTSSTKPGDATFTTKADSSGLIVGAISAVIAISVILIVTVVLVLYFKRRGGRKSKTLHSAQWRRPSHIAVTVKEPEDCEMPVECGQEDGVSEGDMTKDRAQCSASMAMQLEETEVEWNEIESSSQEPAEDSDHFDDLSVPASSAITVQVAQFSDYVQEMQQENQGGNKFVKEFEDLDNLPQAVCDVARLPHNKPHNRFKNIYPYDATRVCLKKVPGVIGSDYINASFITGYDGKNGAYIAAQGPRSETVERFWMMAWEHRIKTIVMLTRCVEMNKEKCAQYWPEKLHDDITPGYKLSVTFLSSLPFAEYEIRKFRVKFLGPGERQLTVTQFHYTAWPDHGVPENLMSVINFIHRVRKLHPVSLDQPLLVHCSAGVGRTGTFVTLDMMLQQMRAEGTLSVCQCVRQLRTQRMKMVQTAVQYEFIHCALSELVVCGETEVAASRLRMATDQLNELEEASGISGFQKHYQILEDISRQHRVNYTEATEEYNNNKNRYPYKLPNTMYRVSLRYDRQPGSDYINASFVNAYRSKCGYIATQGPLHNTVDDFWRMIWEYHCHCIVMLCQLEENGQESSYCYWPREVGEVEVYGRLRVKLSLLNSHGDIAVRKMEVTTVVEDKSWQAVHVEMPTNSLVVTMIQLTSWPEQGLPHPTSITSLADHLTNTQMRSSTKQTVVMCNDGVGRTGTFICIHSQLERLKTEGVVDVFQAIRSARTQRAGLVPSTAHYAFCYEVLSIFVENMDTYANFKETV